MDGTAFRGEDCLTFLGPDLQLDPVSLPGPRLRVLTGPADRVQRIEVGSPEAGATRLRIYDLSGRRVDEILGAEGTGAGVLEWDSRGVPNGIYFLRAESREGPLQGKILLVR
jgi:hypothetical protein